MSEQTTEYLTVQQAIEYSGKSRSTIYRWLYSGVLRGSQDVSNIWHIAKTDLDKVLNKRTPNIIDNNL